LKDHLKAIVSFFLLAILLVAAARSPGAAEVTSPHAALLPNGLRVIVKSDGGPGVVAINLVIRAGSRHEDEQDSGVAHFLEHMLFRGSRNYRPGEAEAMIEGLGGAVNGGTLRDFTHIYATVPSAAFEKTLGALADAALYPALDPPEIERERRIIGSEIAQQKEEPRAAMWDIAHRLLFSNHPYSRPVNGTEESLLSLGRERLAAFHHNWYLPNNMTVVIVGDLSEARALAAVKENFGELERGPVNRPAEPGVPPAPASREHLFYHNGSLAYVALAVKAPGISSPREVCAMDLLTALLAEGKTSRLQLLLLEKDSLALATGAEFLTSREPSPFLIWAACPPEKANEVRTRIEKEISAIARGEISPAEIAAAKRRLETSFWLANETYTEQADVLGFYDAIDTYRFGADYLSRVRGVTLAEIKEAARTYLVPEKGVWLILLPRSKAASSGVVRTQ